MRSFYPILPHTHTKATIAIVLYIAKINTKG